MRFFASPSTSAAPSTVPFVPSHFFGSLSANRCLPAQCLLCAPFKQSPETPHALCSPSINGIANPLFKVRSPCGRHSVGRVALPLVPASPSLLDTREGCRWSARALPLVFLGGSAMWPLVLLPFIISRNSSACVCAPSVRPSLTQVPKSLARISSVSALYSCNSFSRHQTNGDITFGVFSFFLRLLFLLLLASSVHAVYYSRCSVKLEVIFIPPLPSVHTQTHTHPTPSTRF